MNNDIKTLIFDVNETLLDLEPLKNNINTALENENAAEVWFAQLLQYSLVETITGTYHDFTEIAAAIFKLNAQKHEKEFSDKQVNEILGVINKLEPYPEVREALASLKQAGFQLIAFSNGKPSVLKDQLEYAKLDGYFHEVLSVEGIRKYKPHPDAYAYALKESNSVAENSIMIASHCWDITGAQRAGLRTAFIQRPGKFPFPLAEKSTFEFSDLGALAMEFSLPGTAY